MSKNLPELINSLKEATISFRSEYIVKPTSKSDQQPDDFGKIKKLESELISALKSKDDAINQSAASNTEDKTYEKIKLNGVMNNCGFNALAFYVAEAVLNGEDNDALKEFWEFYKRYASPKNSGGTLKEEIEHLLQIPYTDVNSSVFQNKMGFMLRSFFSNKDKSKNKDAELFLDISKNNTTSSLEDRDIKSKMVELGISDSAEFYHGMIADDSIAKMTEFFGINVDIIARASTESNLMMNLLLSRDSENAKKLKDFGIIVDYEGNHYDILLPSKSKALNLLLKGLEQKPELKPINDSLVAEDTFLTPDASPQKSTTKKEDGIVPVAAKLPVEVSIGSIEELIGNSNFKNYYIDNQKTTNDEIIVRYSDNGKREEATDLEIKIKKQNEESVITFNSDNQNYKDDAFRYVKFVAGIAKQQGITDGVITINTNNANKALQLIHYANIYNLRVELSDTAKQGLNSSGLNQTAESLLKINSNESSCNEYKKVILRREEVKSDNTQIQELMSFIDANRESSELGAVDPSQKNTKFEI